MPVRCLPLSQTTDVFALVHVPGMRWRMFYNVKGQPRLHSRGKNLGNLFGKLTSVREKKHERSQRLIYCSGVCGCSAVNLPSPLQAVLTRAGFSCIFWNVFYSFKWFSKFISRLNCWSMKQVYLHIKFLKLWYCFHQEFALGYSVSICSRWHI